MFSKQGLENERVALRGKTELQALVDLLEAFGRALAEASVEDKRAAVVGQRESTVGLHLRSPQESPPTQPATFESKIRNQVWNVLHVEIFEEDEEDVHPDRRGKITLLFLREIWRDVLVRPVDQVPNDFVAAWQVFRRLLMTCEDSTFYAIVQQAGRVEEIREELDKALERSSAPYRFSGEKLVPAASEHETAASKAEDKR